MIIIHNNVSPLGEPYSAIKIVVYIPKSVCNPLINLLLQARSN